VQTSIKNIRILIILLISFSATSLTPGVDASATDSKTYSLNTTHLTKTKGSIMSAQDNARVRAPELSGGRGWLNTDKPLSLAGLKGKVVLLDFWTYGCINCIHIIPDLKKLEAKYPNELVVIGVHSAKFDNEKETEIIRRIIMRY
jgi:thiol-disulfide isomerase/thioredoxin